MIQRLTKTWKIWRKNGVRGVSYGIFLGVLLWFIFIFDSPSRYILTETYIFHSPQKAYVSLGVLIPETGPFQRITELTIQGASRSVEKEGEISVAYASAIADPSAKITLSYHVYLPKGTITRKGIEERTDLLPERFIECDHPEIVRKSGELITSQHNADVRKIYDFVSGWVKWPSGNRVNDSGSAISVYHARTGVCVDFAHLMTALLRAGRIPSHTITGLALPELINFRKASDWNHQAESHAWVEYRADDNWHFADPSWGGNSQFDHSDGRHLSFGTEATEKRVYEKATMMAGSLLKQLSGSDSSPATIGAMTAPLRFIAMASNDKVSIKPKGEVEIIYGYRIPVLILTVLIVILTEWLIRLRCTRSQSLSGNHG